MTITPTLLWMKSDKQNVDFYDFFRNVSISWFKNAYWTLKISPLISSPPIITIYYFFLTFFLFYCDFSFSIASLSIFGNMHRPCKHCCNIANNSLHHVYSFLPWNYTQTMLTVPWHCQQQSTLCPLFLLDISIFWLYLHYLLYLEMCTDHVNSIPHCQ